jgi:hypothetical protein
VEGFIWVGLRRSGGLCHGFSIGLRVVGEKQHWCLVWLVSLLVHVDRDDGTVDDDKRVWKSVFRIHDGWFRSRYTPATA